MSRRTKRRASQQTRSAGQPLRATFDIAQTTRENRNHWGGADALNARASISPGVRRVIRIRSRYEAANNSWYAGILRTAVNHIVGNGPRLQVLTADATANARLERAFARWAKRAQLADMLRTIVEAYWRDGEVFVMRAERPRWYPLSLDLRTLETEQVASPYSGAILADQFVDDGIRFDQSTNEVELYVYDHHPGSNAPVSTLSGRWYPAGQVLHLFRAERPGQTRGLPRATPALPLLPIMRRQQLATLYSAETAANFALYLKTNSPSINPAASPADFAEIEMARNMLTTLPEGWDVAQVEPKQPGPNYEAFQDHTLKSFARCTNMPYPLAAGTAEKSNFSSFKGDMRNVWRPEVITEQNRIEDSIVEPVFAWFMEQAVYVPGLLDGMPPIQDIDHEWRWPPLPDIDPIDTANSNEIKLRTGQITLSELHAGEGGDWETKAKRGATDHGVDVPGYKALVTAGIFGLPPGTPIAPSQTQPSATPPQGEYTEIGQRAFNNNLKRIRSTLDQLISGDISRVFAEQTLSAIGVSSQRIAALIADALDGQVNDPQLQDAELQEAAA